MLKFVNIPVFIASLALGLFFIYVLADDERTVYVYPSSETVDSIAYRDKAGNCFYYKEKVVECPKDKSKIMMIPTQS